MTVRISKKQLAGAGTALVSVDIARPFAVYWDGEQRTGTIEDIPLHIALGWLRQGWASCVSGDAIAELRI